MKRLFYLLSVIVLLGTISGCDNFDLMLSEKKLNSKIQQSWKLVLPYPYDGKSSEVWTFHDGTVSLKLTNGTKDTTYSGTYSVDARFSKAYVSLADFKFTAETPYSHLNSEDANRRWDLVELDNGVFYISSDDSRGTLQSLEFVQQ